MQAGLTTRTLTFREIFLTAAPPVSHALARITPVATEGDEALTAAA